MLLRHIMSNSKLTSKLQTNTSIIETTKDKQVIVTRASKKDVAYFPFNNRGAHYIKKFSRYQKGKKSSVKYGMTYEKIKECILDIDAAISFLRKEGYNEFYLIGHSTGANKICVYNYYKPNNPISKYVLLAGGDDTGLYYKELGREWFHKLLKASKKKTKQGKGAELVKEREMHNIISYQSLYDTINPDGDYNCFPFLEELDKIKLSKKKLFRMYHSIHKPTMVLYGSKDEYLMGSTSKTMECLKKHSGSPEKFTFKVINGANHVFTKQQQELAKVLANYLRGE